MKKLLFCLFALLMLAGCAAASPTRPNDAADTAMTVDFEALVDSVEALLEEHELPAVTTHEGAEDTAACYGFKASALHDGWAHSSAYALEGFEIALFYAKSEANVTIIAEKLRTYLDDLEQKYALAAPGVARRVRDASLLTDGPFCALILCQPELQQELLALINAEISD